MCIYLCKLLCMYNLTCSRGSTNGKLAVITMVMNSMMLKTMTNSDDYDDHNHDDDDSDSDPNSSHNTGATTATTTTTTTARSAVASD